MSEKMVAVPQSLLDKLGKDRQTIYELYPPADIHETIMLTNCTGNMWYLTNTKWEEVVVE